MQSRNVDLCLETGLVGPRRRQGLGPSLLFETPLADHEGGFCLRHLDGPPARDTLLVSPPLRALQRADRLPDR